MSIFDARAGHIMTGFHQQAMPDREFLEKALAAIRRRRGLIHGSLINGGGQVCALGAFAKAHDKTVINLQLAEALQEFNDSMPKVTPKTRRARVIRWIEKRLASMEKPS